MHETNLLIAIKLGPSIYGEKTTSQILVCIAHVSAQVLYVYTYIYIHSYLSLYTLESGCVDMEKTL